MLYSRRHQFLLVASLLWLSWLTMMLIHESGHVLGAWYTGASIQRVVWHPLVISRTDVQPNPHLLIEVWAGPLVGVILPLILAAIASEAKLRSAYLIWFVAGFCLIANGAYIGIGAFDPVGDAKQLITHGSPRWLLVLFGITTAPVGLWIWHLISPRLGFGGNANSINPRLTYIVFAICVLLTLIGFVFGNTGQ